MFFFLQKILIEHTLDKVSAQLLFAAFVFLISCFASLFLSFAFLSQVFSSLRRITFLL